MTPDRVDAHCHVWELARGDYGWLDSSDPALVAIARDFSVTELEETATSNGIAQAVVVQAAPTVAETEYLLSRAGASNMISGVVGWVDLAQARAAQDIERLSRNPAFKGVRPMLQDIEPVDWINEAPDAGALRALVQSGLRFDALVLPQHLSSLLTFAKAHPDLPIVIDHAAKPALGADPSDPRHAMWREGMQALAAETDAVCKVSGLLTEMSVPQRMDPIAVLQPVIDALLAWFGPDRLMWGSDWPVVRLAAPYADWVELADALLVGCSNDERMQIHYGTARDFYGLEAVA